MYRTYQILVMLLKFALYFFIAFAIQFLVLVLLTTDPEFALTIVAIVAAVFAAWVVIFAVSFTLSLPPGLDFLTLWVCWLLRSRRRTSI